MINEELMKEALELVQKQGLSPYEALDISIKNRISDNLRSISEYIEIFHIDGIDVNNRN